MENVESYGRIRRYWLSFWAIPNWEDNNYPFPFWPHKYKEILNADGEFDGEECLYFTLVDCEYIDEIKKLIEYNFPCTKFESIEEKDPVWEPDSKLFTEEERWN